MSELIKKTNWKVVNTKDYGGVCTTATPVSFNGEMLVVLFEDQPDYFRCIPVDIYVCPYCNEIMKIMKIYKSLDVTKELSNV
jgi:hypothetical protein